MGRPRKYFTEEEKKAAIRESQRKYYQTNKEKIAEQSIKYKDKWNEYYKNYYSTKKGKATYLLKDYKKADKKYGRGECTLTVDWIIEHIFSGQCCAHCEETDWRKLGCNRLDNSLPHTPDNVEPCCTRCNKKLPRK